MTYPEDPSQLHGLPPGYELYMGAQEPLPNAIGAVQNFFGEPFSGTLIDRVSSLPIEQVRLLMGDIRRATSRASIAVGARTMAPGNYPREDTFGALTKGDIHLHEASMAGELTEDLPSTRGLKHVALYCGRTIIRDTLCGPLVDDNAGLVFARRLRQIEPIAGLIQAGVFVPVEDIGIDAKRALLYGTLMRSDPHIEHSLNKHPHVKDRLKVIFEQAFYESSLDIDMAPSSPVNIADVLRSCSEALLELYPEMTAEKLLQVLLYCSQVRHGNFTPVTSDLVTARHMLECSAVYDQSDSHYSEVMQQGPSPFMPATVYQVPSLSEVSFADILALRQDEAVFAKLSAALQALAHVCAQDTQRIGDYQSYVNAIRRHAAEIVEPASQELFAWHKRAKNKETVAGLTGEVVGLGFDIVSVPFISRVANTAVRRMMTDKATASRRANAGMAARILKTFL